MSDGKGCDYASPPVVMARLVMLVLAPLGACAVVVAAWVWWFGLPSSADDNKPAVVDADIVETAASDLVAFHGSVKSAWREAENAKDRHKHFTSTMSDRAEHAFGGLGVALHDADFKDFPSLLNSTDRGFQHGSDRLNRMRKDETSEPFARYVEEVRQNVADAAKASRRKVEEDDFHEDLAKRNHAALERLIAGLSGDNKDEAPTPLFGQGYRIEDEHREELRETSTAIFKQLGAFEAPAEIDPRSWHQVENQGQMGSCFPAGTRITMADGSLQAIESVRFGQLVLSHRSIARPVIDTMRRNFTGELITVFAKGWGRLTMTDDHVVLVRRCDREQWVRADGLRDDDLLIISRGIPAYSSQFVDLASYLDLQELYVDDDWLSTRGSHRTKRFAPLDDLACFVIGLYVAEGSTGFDGSGHACRACWSLHEDEMEEAAAIEKWAISFGLTAAVDAKQESKAINVRISSTVLAEFLKNVCGRFCNHKQVPEFILRGTDDQKLAFLRGYYAGDGALGKMDQPRTAASGNLVTCNQIHAATASSVLAQQVSTLCVSLGMKPGRTVTSARDHQNHASHQVYLYSVDAGRLRERNVVAGQTRKLIESDSGQCRKIREITRESVVDFPVFDFTVADDHSFVAEGIIVHNCQGHALSSVCEMADYIASGGRSTRQLSRLFAYYDSQKHDGILGSDCGSTLAGGLAAAKNDGLCPEESMPYPPLRNVRYTGQFTKNAFEDAKPNKIGRHTVCRSYQDVKDFLASGQGGVEIGIRWPDSWMNCSGVLEDFRPGNGGHAVCFLGYSKRKDNDGRNYLWLANSWGSEWGSGGYAEVAPRAVDQMCRHQDTVMIGLSDMSKDDIRRRDVSWIGKGSVFRKTQVAP